jgi:hypothetical protein
VTTPSDLYNTEDPLELFRLTTQALDEYRAVIDQMAEIRARAVAALYSRGYSYKDLASQLQLSAPRIGQLVSSNDSAELKVFKSWANIESLLTELISTLDPADARRLDMNGSTISDAATLELLATNELFSAEALSDLRLIRRTRNNLVHGREKIDEIAAQALATKAMHIQALLNSAIAENRHGAAISRNDSTIATVAVTNTNWETLDAATFERIVYVLLCRERPTTDIRLNFGRRDSGYDVMARTDAGVELYEIVFRAGRLTSQIRSKVSKALEKASTSNPSQWTLITPGNPRPSESSWFESETKSVNFRCSWQGQSWLDSMAIKYPDVVRYFAFGAEAEVFDALKDLSSEQAALSRGVPNSIQRIRSIFVRLNALDPSYSHGFSVQPDGHVEVAKWPRYVNADSFRPARVHAKLAFTNDRVGRESESSFIRALDFGTPTEVPEPFVREVQIEFPDGTVETHPGGSFFLSAAAPNVADTVDAQLRVVTDDGTTVAQLPVMVSSATSGKRGGELLLADPTGSLDAKYTFDDAEGRVNFQFSYHRPPLALPGMLIPAVHLISCLQSGHSLVLMIDGTQAGPALSADDISIPRVDGYLTVLHALHDIQRATGVSFAVPSELTRQDYAAIDSARRLLAGEVVTEQWTSLGISTTAGALDAFRTAFNSGTGQIRTEAEHTLSLGAQEIPIGWVRRDFSTATVKRWPDVAGLPEEAAVEITITPKTSDKKVRLSLQRVATSSEPS